MTPPPIFIDHILFILFGLLLPLNSVFRAQPKLKSLGPWDTRMKIGFYIGNSLSLWVLAIIIVVVWLVSGRSLAWLGFQWSLAGSFGVSILISVVFLVAYGVDVFTDMRSDKAKLKAKKHFKKHTPFLPETAFELRQFTLVAVSAGVCEEVLFRGFFITYILGLLGDSIYAQAVALLLPTGIFAISHFYQGWKAVSKIALLSLAFGILFLISRSLLVPILLHTFVDLASGYAGLKIMQTAPPDPDEWSEPLAHFTEEEE